jgi:hypothetical protein
MPSAPLLHGPLKKLHDLPEFGHQLPRLDQLVLLPNLSAGYRPAVLNSLIKNHKDLNPEILVVEVFQSLMGFDLGNICAKAER